MDETKHAADMDERADRRYQVVFDNTAVGIVVADREGFITEANAAFQHLTGYTLDELKAMRYPEFTHPHEAEKEVPLAAELLRGERESYAMEKRFIRKDGRVIWVHITVTAVRDEHGRAVVPIATVQDITAQKNASRDRDRFFELSQDPIAIIGYEGDFIRLNPAWERALGYHPAEMMRLHPRDFIHPDDIPATAEETQRLLAGHPSMRFENRWRARDGTYRWLSWTATPDPEERVFYAVVRDVTERKRSDLALEESERRREAELDALVESIPGAVFLSDGVGISRTNRYGLDLLGYDSLAEMPLRVSDVMQAAAARDARTGEPLRFEDGMFARALRGEVARRDIILRNRRTGEERIVRAASAPIHLDGESVAAVMIATDVTERAEAEATVRFLAEASLVLATSLDYETTLQSVARLVVPEYADWCSIQLLDEEGQLQTVAVQHADPEKTAWARELGRRYPTRMDNPSGAPNVVRTGQSELYPFIADEILERVAVDEEHLRIVKDVGMKSAIIAPLTARGRTLGVVTFIITDADRRYDEGDLPAIEELARMCALAVDNARLYSEAQREIEERRRAEERAEGLNLDLQRRVEELQTVLDVSPIGFGFALDPSCNHIRPNPALAELLGMPGEENVSMLTPQPRALPFRIFHDGKPVSPHDLPMQRAAREARPTRGEEFEITRDDGRRLILLEYASPLFDAGGRVRGSVGAFVDITELKQTELELRRLSGSLEQRVTERTAELEAANEHLKSEIAERRRAEVALERTNATLLTRNRELQDFAYVASHDLQEPLRKISTFAELLGQEYESALGEEGRMYLERMQSAAQRMSSLIHDLLQFSRVATKGQPFEMVDLNRIVSEVLSDLEVRIEETSAAVEVDDLPQIEADPVQMRQLFQNLIGNALKFHKPDTAPQVRLRAAVEENAQGRAAGRRLCRMEVTDNGIGFDEKYLDRIFSPFQRLHTRHEYQGTGMGLAICRRIIERHHGSITARSTEGEGSTFIILLPVEQEKAPGQAGDAAPPVSPPADEA